jgi:type II secretory pathway predicted ATPase ExeA
MYPQFFGLDKLPFRLRPDAVFLYSGVEYTRARAKLLAGLHGESRLNLLMGPPGVGKTLLLEDVLGEIAPKLALYRINQPHISATELLQALLLQMGTPSGSSDTSLPRLLKELTASVDALDARQRAAQLLIVDDAQLLAGGTVGTFAQILNRAPRLKILLAGRDGRKQGVAGIAARVGWPEAPLYVQLHPLNAEGTRGYIERRLTVAGAGGKELFTADAYAAVFQQTAGSARLINALCDAALHAACARASGQVSASDVVMATQDSRWPEAMARDGARAEVVAVDAPVSSAQLFISLGTEHVAALPLSVGRVSIGRAPENDLRLDARFISRRHCQVVTVGSVSTIEDLGSVNGMCVNGKPATRHVLQHADQITLGEYVLTYLVS